MLPAVPSINENDQGTSVVIDSQGRIVIAGTSANSSNGAEVALWRFNSNGTPDTTFGGGVEYIVSGATGAAGATGATENDVAWGIQIDSQGRYVVVGQSANTSSSSYNNGQEVAIWRYNSAGSLDTTFGSPHGYVASGATGMAGGTGIGENDVPVGFQIDSQGRYVIAASSENSSSGHEVAMMRYNANGTLDASFGAGQGYVVTSTGTMSSSGDSGSGYEMLIDSRGRSLVTGIVYNSSGGTELGTWRFTSSGSLDQ